VIDLARTEEFQVGSLTLTPGKCRLSHANGRSEVLQPRVMQVLIALARNPGAVLTRDDLINCCWCGRIVGDDSINRVIYRLRQASEEVGGFCIQTIPKVGYLFAIEEAVPAPAATVNEESHKAFSDALTILRSPKSRSDEDCVGVDGLPLSWLEDAREKTSEVASTLEGFWQSTRATPVLNGMIVHDHGMIRKAPNGLLEIRMGVAGIPLQGWLLPNEKNLFLIINDVGGMCPVFATLTNTSSSGSTTLEGLLMQAAFDAQRTPTAVPVILERVGDLTGDLTKDDEECATFISRMSLRTTSELSDTLRRFLIPDVGPVAASSGGQMFLQGRSA
jgi:DNA-binding winged helix-turn-helix (wHTH) protein